MTTPPPAEGEPGEPAADAQPAADARPTAEPEWAAGLRVPDDARELEHDLQAWRREQAADRRRARWRRLLLTRRWETYGLSGPLVAVALAVVTVAALAVALLVPAGRPERPQPAQLAAPSIRAGAVGGLLPVVALQGAGRAPVDRQSRDLRPGVVALVPAGCDPLGACRAAVVDAERTARDRSLPTWVVGADAQLLVRLAREPVDGGGYAVPLVDRAGVLAATYTVDGALPTLLLVDPHGVLRVVLPAYAAGTSGLLGDLARLQ